MLGSVLLLLTMSSGALLVPACIAFLMAGQHAHMAPRDGSARRSRVISGAALTGLGGFVAASLFGAGAADAAVVAVVLSAGVMAGWRRGRIWAVRGIVVWSLLVLGTVALLGWLALRIVGSTWSLPSGLSTLAWLVLLVAVTRVRGYAHDRIAERAVREAPQERRDGARHPVPWLVAALGAGGLAVALTVVEAGPWGQAPWQVTGRTAPDARPTAADSESARSKEHDAKESRQAAASSRDARARDAGPLGADRTTEPATADPAPTPTSATPVAPAPAPVPESPDKTPGYAKDNPNRPDHAGTPGGRSRER